MSARTLTITAAEWASVQDGRLWLVREGWWEYTSACEGVAPTELRTPPDEFVQACAPCERCDGERRVACPGPSVSPKSQLQRDAAGLVAGVDYCYGMHMGHPCLDCRIELVGPCCGADDGYCFQGNCYKIPGSCILGHAYAVGQPLPIIHVSQSGYPSIYVFSGGTYIDRGGWDVAESADLAHYGPPETLVGKWALELAVVS